MVEIASWLTKIFSKYSVTSEFNGLGIEFVHEQIHTGDG